MFIVMGRLRLKPKYPKRKTYYCHCDCPNWGIEPPEGIWKVQNQDCGHIMFICGMCVQNNRYQECPICHPKRSHHNKDN